MRKITVMLEALQIMLAGEFWLRKAMQALFRPDIFERMIASVHSSTTKSASVKLLFDQCWHLSLVLYPLHAPLDLQNLSAVA